MPKLKEEEEIASKAKSTVGRWCPEGEALWGVLGERVLRGVGGGKRGKGTDWAAFRTCKGDRRGQSRGEARPGGFE